MNRYAVVKHTSSKNLWRRNLTTAGMVVDGWSATAESAIGDGNSSYIASAGDNSQVLITQFRTFMPFVAGTMGQALRFQNSEYLTIPNDTDFDIPIEQSFAFWFVLDSTPAGDRYIISRDNTASPPFSIYVSSSRYIYYDIDGSYPSSNTKLTVGNKYHVVMRTYVMAPGVYGQQIWLNGVMDYQYDAGMSSNPPAGVCDLIMGANWSGSTPTAFINGNVDEFSIWNRIITDGEIASLYNGGVGIATETVSTTGLVALYKFDNNFDDLQGHDAAQHPSDDTSFVTLTEVMADVTGLSTFDSSTDEVSLLAATQTQIDDIETAVGGIVTPPTVEQIDTELTTNHGAGNWDTVAPTVEQIDTELTTNHGSGSWGAGAVGSLSVTVTLKEADLTPIADVQVDIRNAADNLVVGSTTSNASGVASFNLNAGTYKVRPRKTGFSFPAVTTWVVDVDLENLAITGTEITSGTVPGADQGRIAGYLVEPDGDPLVNAEIQFRPTEQSTYNGRLINNLSTYYTDANGYVEIDLIGVDKFDQDGYYYMTIDQLGIYRHKFAIESGDTFDFQDIIEWSESV